MRYLTAGESHGETLCLIAEGLPSGLALDIDKINRDLARRMSGYGRGGRMSIENDKAHFVAGVRSGLTTGAPIAVLIANRDSENWTDYMRPFGEAAAGRQVTHVRPGHADFVGCVKYGHTDARNVLERASARETAARTAAGALCRQLLRALGVEITGYVRSVGGVKDDGEYSFEAIRSGRGEKLMMMDRAAEARAAEEIDRLKAAGDTCGGVCELRVSGLKSGFGSCMTYAEKLDARLCGAMLSVQAVKGAEVGLGFAAAERKGSEAHDGLSVLNGRAFRETNRAGGIEGGMSNGEELVLRAAMKPIPTLMRGLHTIDIKTGEPAIAAAERSDVCALPACETVLENVIACELCAVVLERLGGDRMDKIIERYGELLP